MISSHMAKNLPYDPLKSFAPVILQVTVPNILVVHPSIPANTLAELISYAKANPGKLSYASQGTGASGHIAAELLKLHAGIDIVHAAPPLPPASRALLRATLAEGFWRVSAGCERNRRAGIRGQRLPQSFRGAPGLSWDYWKKLFFVVCTPTLVNSSAMLGLISFATSKSALLAATSPFINLATPRPYSAAGEFGVSFSASS